MIKICHTSRCLSWTHGTSPFLKNGDLSESMYCFGIRLKLDMLLAFMVLKVQCSAIFIMVSSLRLVPRKPDNRLRDAGRSYKESTWTHVLSLRLFEAAVVIFLRKIEIL